MKVYPSVIVIALALLIAAVLSAVWRPVALEERLVQLQLEQILPADAGTLATQPLELRALLVDYADDRLLLLQAQAALERHPALAQTVLLAFGDAPPFRAALQEFGPAAIPPIHFFMHNDINTVTLMQKAGDLAEWLRMQLRRNPSGDDTALEPLPPEIERGAYAIAFIRAEGHDFIGQFATSEDGTVAWVQTERALEGLTRFFASGIRNIEIRARLGESLRWQDYAHGAVDIAIGVGAFKVLKATRGGAVATRQTGLATRSVALAPVMVNRSAVASRLLRVGAPLAAGYLMIRHPSLFNSGLGWLAERLDLPVWLVQFTGWTLLLSPLLYLAYLLTRPLIVALVRGARNSTRIALNP